MANKAQQRETTSPIPVTDSRVKVVIRAFCEAITAPMMWLGKWLYPEGKQ